jgi:hypothetical protein
MRLLKQMDEPLSQIVADVTRLSANDTVRIVQLVSDVRVGILQMQVLLLPHIAEASDQKMDEFEQQLSAIDQKIHEDFTALTALLQRSDQQKLEATRSRYAEFEKLRSRIIELSRQNTDLRAVAIALTAKRKAMLACQDALVALEHAIRAEPIVSTIPSGRSPQ